jgi:hypothetical protein
LLSALYAVLSYHTERGVDVVDSEREDERETTRVSLSGLRALGLERCDSADLIYAFLTHGDHAAACVFMTALLTKSESASRASGAGGQFVYYNLVDVVVSSAEKALSAGQEGQDLRVELGRLKSVLGDRLKHRAAQVVW